MSPYELKKINVELLRVHSARCEQELRIMEFQEQIARLEASIKISVTKEEELQAKIAEMQKIGND
jgi:bifunctional ADP-heptose synthase (sugar kinase/adenylyltransferase)